MPRPLSCRLAMRLVLKVVLVGPVVFACRDDSTSPAGPVSPGPDLVATTPLAFSQVSAGWEWHEGFACGVTSEHAAYCWGSNLLGQLGIGTDTGPENCPIDPGFTAPCSTRPVPVAGGHPFRQVSAGRASSCGVTTDNRVWCWGVNGSGQLGDGTTAERLRPVVVAGGLRFRQVAAGSQHTCGVTTADRVYCWGWNYSAQLGDGTRTQRLTPAAVAGGHLFREVSVGEFHTCGLTTSDVVYCWGSNERGQLGDSSIIGRRYRPVRVAGGRLFRQVDAGEEHTCAVTTDYRAFCWGDGQHGQIGNGKRYLSFWPRPVSGGLSFERVTAGATHTCGETTANRAYCWGSGADGALGDGAAELRLTPVPVIGGLRFSQVSAGGRQTCGRTPAAVVWCWGNNDKGGLGDGTTTTRLEPTPVVGPT